jgi:DNA replication protein DnaC
MAEIDEAEKALKLPTFQREHQKLARLCASEGVEHVGYLTRLAEREMIERDRRKVERRIKAARFPVVKSLDSFDFDAIPKLNRMQVLELARCEWIERRENVIALGPSGTGKNRHEQRSRVIGFQMLVSVSGFPCKTIVHIL